jgi:hypothetical protein
VAGSFEHGIDRYGSIKDLESLGLTEGLLASQEGLFHSIALLLLKVERFSILIHSSETFVIYFHDKITHRHF